MEENKEKVRDNFSFIGAFFDIIVFLKNIMLLAFLIPFGLPWYVNGFFVVIGILLVLLILKYIPTVGGGG